MQSAVPGMPPLLNGCVEIVLHEARGLPKTDNLGFTEGDPLCMVQDSQKRVLLKTKVVRKTTEPQWEESGIVSLVECGSLTVLIKDSDATSEDLMTKVILKADGKTLRPVLDGIPVTGWIPMDKQKAEVRISIKPLMHRCPGRLGVTNSRFPSNPGCRVTLYQSAHVGGERDYLPYLSQYNGCEGQGIGAKKRHVDPEHAFEADDDAEGARAFNPRNCWEELYVAILEARQFIYVVGWSVFTDVPLLRERDVKVKGYEELDGTKVILGDLFAMKAQEGVKVSVMLWREATSVGNDFASSDGVAGTFSEKTKAFFRSKEPPHVHCKTFLRQSESSMTLNKLCYTHHQKYVVCDAPALSDSRKPRRLIGFIGGIDLTKGRFDTPKKHLWGTADGWHKGDWYQACVPGVDEIDGKEQGCRQPWADIHAKIEGPVVRDLITNFEDRWLKQAGEKWSHALFDVDECDEILPREEDYVQDPDFHESWNVQFLRSIDHNSALNILGVEGGIHNAYDLAIERAERFLYLENQYFMGGSKSWKSHKGANILSNLTSLLAREEVQSINRIPLMIVNRIGRAIRENKRFSAYICIPMFPEGLPESAAMQEIIYWQYNTMEMMYSLIAQIIKNTSTQASPEDYLNFFCLGNREPEGPLAGMGTTSARKDVINNTRRHMIYVHSKMLIADDDYIILGSANINDRSMAGDRDTEVAIGAYQPHHSRANGVKFANGGVQAFRLSVWGEHLNEGGTVNSALYYPESKACVDYVNTKSYKAWKDHAGDLVQKQECHLMKYPIVVNPDGSIRPIQECFPDAPAAKIRGVESATIPDFMTS